MRTPKADLRSAQADHQLADIEFQRILTLARSSVTDQQSLDVATAHQRDAAAHLDAATAAVTRAEGILHLHERAVDTARTALELAEWRLERTFVVIRVGEI